MQNKKRKTSVGFALLVVAMISLVGVGFALQYSGSATINNQSATGEAVTVDLDKYSGFIAGAYTVNTSNDGTTISLTNLAKNGTTVDPLYTAKVFKYESSNFTLVDSYGGSDRHYGAAEVGSIQVTIRQTANATTSTPVVLSITGNQAPVVNADGLSFVYVIDNTVIDPATPINVTLTGESGTAKTASVTLKAYVVYSESVDHVNINSITAFNLANSNIVFTATVGSA